MKTGKKLLLLLSFLLGSAALMAGSPEAADAALVNGHQGFTLMSLVRGLLGLSVLVALMYLFSSNRKELTDSELILLLQPTIIDESEEQKNVKFNLQCRITVLGLQKEKRQMLEVYEWA